MKVGLQSHLLFGHGATQDAFEARDLGSTNTEVYDKLQKTHTFTNPHYNVDGLSGPCRNQHQINARVEDLAPVFGGAARGADQLNSMKPKHYSKFTKKFDSNYLKTGLRQ